MLFFKVLLIVNIVKFIFYLKMRMERQRSQYSDIVSRPYLCRLPTVPYAFELFGYFYHSDRNLQFYLFKVYTNYSITQCGLVLSNMELYLKMLNFSVQQIDGNYLFSFHLSASKYKFIKKWMIFVKITYIVNLFARFFQNV